MINKRRFFIGWVGEFFGSMITAFIKTKVKLDQNELGQSGQSTDFCPEETKTFGREICIIVLKTAAKCICTVYNEDAIRGVTYSYLALRHTGLD